MQPIPFIAASAEEAVAQIRARLGPEAVVLNVRPMPVNGLARLWQRPMIEVLAHVPEVRPVPDAPLTEALAEFRQQLEEIKQQVESRPAAVEPESWAQETVPPTLGTGTSGGWRVGTVLEKTGLRPLAVQAVVDRLRATHGEQPPANLGDEIQLTRQVMAALWRPVRPLERNSLHALIGPAGSGKTTTLCKWLTQASLVEGKLARVWRLDGATANMAESLTIYCDILGLPTERAWQGSSVPNEDLGFLDLPGVDWRQPSVIRELGTQLERYGSPRLHLVLNGAYDLANLQAQVRAFSVLPIEDLIITHLDEESCWGKVWNLVLGTNYSVRYFSTGQNIPGDFCEATPELLLSRQFPRK